MVFWALPFIKKKTKQHNSVATLCLKDLPNRNPCWRATYINTRYFNRPDTDSESVSGVPVHSVVVLELTKSVYLCDSSSFPNTNMTFPLASLEDVKRNTWKYVFYTLWREKYWEVSPRAIYWTFGNVCLKKKRLSTAAFGMWQADMTNMQGVSSYKRWDSS